MSSEGKHAEPAPPQVNVLSVDVTPNMCPLEEPLTLRMEFENEAKLPDSCWEIKYMVDTVSHRHIITLGTTETTTYRAGRNEFSFSVWLGSPDAEYGVSRRVQVDHIDVSGIKPSALTNAGLLIASLKSAGEEVLDVNMVVQVTKEDGKLMRCVYSPLE